VRPELDLGGYSKIVIEPVAVALAADSTGQAVDPAELSNLARYFRDALVLAVQERYPVVEESGPEVLRLRAAITDVVPTRPVLNTAGTLVVPARVASAGKRAITGTHLFVGEVAIEAELLDSARGTRLIALVDRKAGDKLGLKRGATTWGHVAKAFREWAVAFRVRLDRERALARRRRAAEEDVDP
jgi:hypothetical protein